MLLLTTINMILTLQRETIYDNYRTELILKKDRGKLDKIIRTEKRAKREKKQEVKDE